MLRTGLYIDGLNSYHAIADFQRSVPQPEFPSRLHWLDYKKLGAELNRTSVHGLPSERELVAVKYFVAIPEHREIKADFHRRHIRALEHSGVQIFQGRFKEHPAKCAACRNTFRQFQEKESDVNLALEMYHDSMMNLVDVIFLLTTDSDLAAAVKRIQALSSRQVAVVPVSFSSRSASKELLSLSMNGKVSIRPSLINRCLLDRVVTTPFGDVRCPDEYWA